jgi:sarcosine oxidase
LTTAIAETSREADVLVIGGGVVGAAAARAAATEGARVVLLERHSLADAEGSSKGTARIYAPAAYPDEEYLEMGLRAVARWREVEARVGEQLLWPTGVVSAGGFAERQLPLLRAAGVEAEVLDAADGWHRFGIRVGARGALVHQPDAGVIRADRARSALLSLAREAGVDLRAGHAADSLETDGDHVLVRTGRLGWHARAAIVAAGPWSGPLLAGAGIEVPLAVTRQTVAYFELADGASPPRALIDYDGDEPYALRDPARGLKAALHRRGPLTDPDERVHAADPAAVERLAAWVEESFPQLTAGLTGTETCLYTNTLDERLALERHGHIVVAAACNGQGFQLAPETGQRLAALALDPAEVGAR